MAVVLALACAAVLGAADFLGWPARRGMRRAAALRHERVRRAQHPAQATGR